MGRRLTPRLFLITFAIVLAAYFLYPTVRLQTLSDEERFSLDAEGRLAGLEAQALKLGLDLKGGIHVALEVDIPKLVENIAQNKTPNFNAVLDAARAAMAVSRTPFLTEFQKAADESGLRLVRHFTEKGIENSEIISALRDEADDAVNRALEVIRNRVDQFGVAEPTIQKQGSDRIIVELAGVDDPARARELIQRTAQLEFTLLRDEEVAQAAIRRIDAVLKRLRSADDADTTFEPESPDLQAADTTDTTATQLPSQDRTLKIEELFGATTPGVADDESTIIVDEQIFEERPFSALLRNLGGNIGVPLKNVNAVRRILAMPEVKNQIPADTEFMWSSEVENFSARGAPADRYYRLYVMNSEPALTGEVVTSAVATVGGTGSDAFGQALVLLGMNSSGAKVWSRVTGANIGRRVAIVLDDKVHSAPVIRGKIPSGDTQIEGVGDITEARDLAIVLRAGALPAPMQVIEERTIGPSLGLDSIKAGTTATILGLIVVLVFMVFYYRLSGIIADFALILNLTFVLAILAALHATLTLPGIAGLILTVGMSVDANVLIFERIREELRKGKTVRTAIDSGYSRALTTIIDANVTTLIAALVLFQFGTGPVKGFAVTLFWGISASMFTAIFVTRTVFDYITQRRTLRQLSI